MDPQAGTHGLQILNAQKEDAGQYTCIVTNELGEASKNYHVEVLSEPPGNPGTLAGQAEESWPHLRPREPSCACGKRVSVIPPSCLGDSVRLWSRCPHPSPSCLPTATCGVEMQPGITPGPLETTPGTPCFISPIPYPSLALSNYNWVPFQNPIVPVPSLGSLTNGSGSQDPPQASSSHTLWLFSPPLHLQR